MDNIKWVSKALARKDSGREALEQLAYLDGKVVAADGARLHAWKGEADITTPDKYPDLLPIMLQAKSGQTTVTISKYHLVQACRAIKALRGLPYITLWFDHYLHCEGEADAYPTIAGENKVRVDIKNSDDWPSKSSKKYPMGKPHIVHHKHTGPPLYIEINPTFLIDSLSGMDDIVTLTLQGWSDPVYIRSEEKIDGWPTLPMDIKEAVIMPMNTERR